MDTHDLQYADFALWNEFRRWCASDLARRLRAEETRCLEDLLVGLFGYHLVQLGGLGPKGSLGSSHIRRHTLIDVNAVGGTEGSWIRADFRRLPIATDTVDVVLLPHVLDFAPGPGQILREVERVLIPQGRLIVAGFNPWGWWVLGQFGRQGTLPPWRGQFMGLGRLRRWLASSGFDLETHRWVLPVSPVASALLARRLESFARWGQHWWDPLSAVYLARAVKRVATLTPVKTIWARERRLLSTGAMEPTTRRLTDD
jgi:SAM-dependent methyltransferase